MAVVALLNLAYFGVEFGVARAIDAVALFADSIDFLEDAAVNLLVLLALGWSARRRAQVGMGLAAILLIPAACAAAAAWQKLSAPTPPDPLLLSAAGLGALAVNVFCALLLARFRRERDSLTRAAFLSARNDALANLAILAAAAVTTVWVSAWPDVIVGLGILLLNLDAAHEVFETARREQHPVDATRT